MQIVLNLQGTCLNLVCTRLERPPDTDVLSNCIGLAQKLHSCGIVTSPNEVLAFGRAFGLAQPLFAFIDVGMGKERADHKIRETLRLYLPNAQCKHCFFGPTHDNGYVVVLEGYKREFSSRLTLVETRPAESGFVELGLKLISFPKVFRSENLPNKIVSHGPPALVTQPMHPPPRTSSAVPVHKTPAAITIRNGITNQINAHSAPFVPGSSSPVQSADSAASNTWATVGKPSNGAKNINIAPKKSAPPPPRRFILQNVYDDRLDIKLPETDKVAEGRFAERMRTSGKMCNSYHLTGRCHAGEYCDYDHGAAPLSPGELLVLRHKARSRSCPQNHACRDFECTFGHHCRYGPSCTARETCWFSNTHGVDLVRSWFFPGGFFPSPLTLTRATNRNRPRRSLKTAPSSGCSHISKTHASRRRDLFPPSPRRAVVGFLWLTKTGRMTLGVSQKQTLAYDR